MIKSYWLDLIWWQEESYEKSLVVVGICREGIGGQTVKRSQDMIKSYWLDQNTDDRIVEIRVTSSWSMSGGNNGQIVKES